jgi:lysophospholipase L1-like esterase
MIDGRRVKRALTRLLLLTAVSLVCIILLEIAHRRLNNIPVSGNLRDGRGGSARIATFQKSRNDLLVYEPVPNARSHYSRVPNSLNSHGMRDREFSLEKPDGSFRIVALGDSIIYGYGVRIEDTLVKKLERKLNRSFDTDFEVLNFGVPGYSTQQETELYRVRARRFDPDLVLIGYDLNDEIESSHEIRLFDRTHFSVFEKLYFIDFLRISIRTLLATHLGLPFPRYRAETRVADNFQALRASVDPGIPIVVVIFPRLVDFSDYQLGPIHREVAEAGRDAGFHVLDLFDHFKERDFSSLRIVADDHEHPNASGNELAANATWHFLIRENLIPRDAGTAR